MLRFLYPACLMGFLCLLGSARAEHRAEGLPPGAIARFGASHLHIGNASFQLSPDGRSILVLTPEGNLQSLDAQTGRLLECRQLRERSDVDPTQGSRAQLSADGRTALLEEPSYTGNRLTVLDVATGKSIFRRVSTEKRRLCSGCLSPDGKQLAVIEGDGSSENSKARVRLIDLLSGRVKEMGPFQHSLLHLLFSADGKRLIIGEQDIARTNNIHVHGQPAPYNLIAFDLSSGKELRRRTVWGIGFDISRDGKSVIVSSNPVREHWDGSQSSFIWGGLGASGFHIVDMDAEAGKPAERFLSFGQWPGIAHFVLAPDDRTIILNHVDDHGASSIVLWGLKTRKEVRRFKLPQREDGSYIIPLSLKIAADGRTLLTHGDYLQRWDLKTGKPFLAPPADDWIGSLLQIAFTPDGKEIIASSLNNRTVRWDVATGKRIGLIPDHFGGTPFFRTPDGLRTVQYHFSDRRFVFALADPLARKTLRTIHWEALPEDAAPKVPAYLLTADGKTLLAIHTGKKNIHVTSWDTATGARQSHFTAPGNPHFSRTPFSPCGRWVMLNGKLYHVGSGTELFAPAGKSGERLIAGDAPGPVWFSDDGRLMAAQLRKEGATSAADDTLAVWEVASGQLLARFPHGGFIAQVAFAPDGRTIALVDAHGIRLEDVLSGKRLATYLAPDVICGDAGNGNDVQGVVFSPDGRTLATGHHNGAILLWPVPHGEEPAALAEGDKDRLWQDLGSPSLATARAAVVRLSRHPTEAAPLLVARFHPRPSPDDAIIASLIKDLDSDEFATRREAARKLRQYGPKGEPALQRTLAGAPSLEMRRRIETILAERTPLELRLPLTGEHLRGVRAMEVLERIGTPECRKLLQAWVEQCGDLSLAREARLARQRLGPGK